jgi:putative SOS response-associated peptidase YedK
VCGRVAYTAPSADLLASYPWLTEAPAPEPRYNLAPTDPVVVVASDGADVVRWGISGRRGGLFNLRAETAVQRPYYHGLLLRHRVVVPVSHFYEWRRAGAARQPMAVARVDGRLLNLAGLLGHWEEDTRAVTIITTVPNADLAPLHDRMPVVLSDDDAATWVLEDLSLEQAAAFLRPCPDGWLVVRPASPLVNSVRNEGPKLLDPTALPATFQLELPT